VFADKNVANGKTINVTNLQLSGLDAGNYVLATASVATTANITPVTLTVAADNAARFYGTANPVFTASYNGFVNSEGTGELSGSPSLTTTATQASLAGDYAITAAVGTLSAQNYLFTFVNGTLTVTSEGILFSDDFSRASDPVSLVSPWSVHSGDWSVTGGKLLGGTNPGFSYGTVFADVAWTNYSVSARIQFPGASAFGASIGGHLNASTGARYEAWVYPEGSSSSVGANALALIKFQDWDLWGYTNTSYVPMVVTNLPGVGTDPHLVKLKFDGSQISVYYDGNLMITTTDVENAPYTIGGITANMWTDNLFPYVLTVDDVLVTTPTAQSINFAALGDKTYGDAPFAVNATASSSLPVTFSVVSGPATVSGNMVTITGAGAVTIRASQGGNDVYIPATDVDRSFTVNPAALSVTADSTSRLYGSANPAFTGNLVGVVNSDAIIASYSTVADETSSVGNYDIVPSLSDPNSRLSNYVVASTNSVLTVTPAALSVTADSTSRIYGSANPAFSGNLVGVLNNDGILASYSTVADVSSSVANYDIVPSLSDPNSRLSNYIVASTNGTLSITPAALSVTANNASRGYGAANPIFSGSLLGVLNNDGITAGYGTSAGTNSAVGNYDIAPTLIDLNNRLGNYVVSSTNGVLSVLPAALLVTADNQSRVFGATNPVLTVSYSGFVNGETPVVLSGTADVTTSADTNSPIGSYEIVASLGTLSNANYSFGFSNGTLTVTMAGLLVTADNQSRTYGSMNPVLTVSYSGFVNGEGAGDLGGAPSVNTSADTTSSVGNYDVIVSLGSLSNTNYTYSFSNGTLNVTAASLSVTADSASKVYGSTNPAFTGNVVGVLNNDGITASYSTTADETSSVGNYNIVPALSDPNNKLSNYVVASTNGVLTVTPAALSVTADSTTKVYGSVNPGFTGNVVGVLNNDGIAASYSTVADETSSVGNYDIIPSLLDPNNRLNNYIVASTNGMLTVTPAALSVTANNTSRGYGEANPFFTGNLMGVVNNDDITASYSTAAGTNSPVGNYDIVPTLVDLNNRLVNYIVSSTNGVLSVLPTALLVTADNQSRVFGTTNPVLTVSYSGFVNGETLAVLSGVPDVTTSADTNSPIGSYEIMASLGSLSNANYTFGFSNGTLTVTAAALLVTADNQTRTYGSTNPVLTVNYSGFVNGEGAGDLGGTPSVTTSADTASSVGNYDVVVTLGSLSNTNYSYSFSHGTLNVTAASLSVTADSTSRIYGSANPAFSGNLVGVLNSDGIVASYSTVADGTSPVGNYDIVPSLSDPNSKLSNYVLASTNGVLTVTPAALSVTADSASRIYGSANPALTGSLLGLLNNDGILASYSTVADETSSVGNYDIVPSLSDPNNRLGNYILSSTNGTLSIRSAALSVTANNASRGYGAANPIFTGSLLGVLNNDGITASYSTVAGTNSPVGNYEIVPTLIDLNNRLGNYNVSPTNGVLSVLPAALLVTADNQSRVFGATNPVLTVSYSGFVNGETPAVLSGAVDLSTSADTNSPIGSYEIVASLGSLSNANYSFGFSNGTLTVTTAALLITADNQSRIYGATNPVLTVTYNGFVNGEGAGDLGGTPSVTTQADITSSVGNYDIVVSLGSLSNTNYTYSFSNGTLNVTAASLSVTADSTSRIYGSANPTLKGNVVGVLNNDGITANYSTAADETSLVGNYDIVPALSDPNSKLSNYIVASTNGVLSITPAALSVTAGSTSRIYGSANPAFTGNLLGVLNSDGILASYSTVADETSSVGNYDIVPALSDPNNRLSNYIVASTNGVLSITPAALSVTANNAIKVYGAANPSLTGNLIGVLNGDGIAASYSTLAGTNSPVGSYDIVPTLIDANNRLSNFAVFSTNGTLSVFPAALLVTADNHSRVYGVTNPALTASYSGFVNGEAMAALSGAPDITTIADTNSAVGSYDIVASLGSLSNANYNFGFSNGTLTVTVAELLITAENQSRVYGATNTALTVNYSGFVNGEGVGALAGSPSVTTIATTISPVGNYDIVVGLGSLNNANYSFVFSNATLSVTAASLSVTADSTSRIYGAGNPAFTGNLQGVLNNDGIAANYSSVADVTSQVGNYDIVPALSDPNGRLTNYTVASTNGVLTVTPAALGVTANNATRAYGAANPAFGGSVVGVLNSDGITASYATAADANSPVGVYDIVPGLVDPNNRLSNYAVASTNGALTVTAGIASINWSNPANIIYGTALGAAQLNASGSVPGALVYTPAAGTVLGVGNAQQMSVTLTPTDTNYASAQASVFINVLASGSTMALESSTNPALPGATVIFTATMTATPPGSGTPSGTVQFLIDGSPAGAPVALVSGAAAISTSTLTHGSHTVAAIYGGDSNFTGTSNNLAAAQVINTPPTAPTYFIFTTQNTPVAFSAENVMVAVTDADGDSTNLTSVSATSTNGGMAALESGMITFSPLAGSTNQDTISYTVTDSLGGSTTGLVSVVIIPAVGAPPSAPVTMLSSGHAMLALSAVAGDTYIVQGSADLHTWMNLSRLVSGPDGNVRMEDGDAPAYPARYYRLIIP
jgi:putative lipoic acid-binding regulatory protein